MYTAANVWKIKKSNCTKKQLVQPTWRIICVMRTVSFLADEYESFVFEFENLSDPICLLVIFGMWKWLISTVFSAMKFEPYAEICLVHQSTARICEAPQRNQAYVGHV